MMHEGTEAPATAGSEDDAPHPPRSVSRISDPRALRALAHPLRLSLLALLRTHGPLTATKAGELLNESSASCSFHLRQLSKYGLVEEAGGGHGRERPWRAAAMSTAVPDIRDNPDFAAAAQLFRSTVLDRYHESALRWLENQSDEPAEWQRAAQFGDVLMYVTAEELEALNSQIHLAQRYSERLANPESRPPGARLVTFIQLGFPLIEGSEQP